VCNFVKICLQLKSNFGYEKLNKVFLQLFNNIEHNLNKIL